MKLGLISLGCCKNRIDSELFMGISIKYGIEITNDIKQADIIVINTCGFIAPAKKEALDTIFEMLEYQKNGKKVIVIGCLVERYLDTLKKEIPEVDYFIPIRNYNSLDSFFKNITGISESYSMYDYSQRILSTNKSSAYIRIAEGCNNRCNYCAIPLIRGKFISRTIDSIMEEAQFLQKQGIKELTLIAQDTTRFGSDNHQGNLAILLDTIASKKWFKLIRVLYLYPDEITNELIEVIRKHDSIVKYFDIPLQHASNSQLQLMNRRGTKENYIELIGNIRKIIPRVLIRTTMITGFPCEKKKDFMELIDFIKEIKFDYLGAFCYSDEEDTIAYNMHPKVSGKIAQQRLDLLLATQQKIAFDIGKNRIGEEHLAIIEKVDSYHQKYIGRLDIQAPDGVDGHVFVKMKGTEYEVGDFINVQISNYSGYDYDAIIIRKEINNENN